MNSLEGKVTLVTGAKGGLGNFVTEAFLAAGGKKFRLIPCLNESPEWIDALAEISIKHFSK